MDFVGDYQKKQKLASALRKREKALLDMQVDTGPIVTQAQGTFPGMVQANWAAPLAQLGQAYFANKAGEKAQAAEDEAVAARRQGLYGILGMQQPGAPEAVPQGGDVGPVQPGAAPMIPAGQPGAQAPAGLPEDFQMTPDKVLALSELGIDPSMVKMMTPEKEKLANLLQALPNLSPEGAEMLGPMFGLKPGEGTKLVQGAIQQREAARQQAIDDKVEIYNATHGRSGGGGGGGGGSGGGGGAPAPAGVPGVNTDKPANAPAYDKKFAEEQAKADVKLLDGESKLRTALDTVNSYIKADQAKPYDSGSKYRIMDSLTPAVAGGNVSDFYSEVQKQEQDIQQFHLNAMEQMRGFGQVTENEQKIISGTQFSRYDSAEARTKKLDTIRAAIESGLKKVEAAKARARGGSSTPAKSGGGMTSPGGVSFTVE